MQINHDLLMFVKHLFFGLIILGGISTCDWEGTVYMTNPATRKSSIKGKSINKFIYYIFMILSYSPSFVFSLTGAVLPKTSPRASS